MNQILTYIISTVGSSFVGGIFAGFTLAASSYDIEGFRLASFLDWAFILSTIGFIFALTVTGTFGVVAHIYLRRFNKHSYKSVVALALAISPFLILIPNFGSEPLLFVYSAIVAVFTSLCFHYIYMRISNGS